MMKPITIYGAGLFGLTLGRVLQDRGYEVHIKEKLDHIGGMLSTHRSVDGVEIHEHGAHIFHTDNDRVIEFVQQHSLWIPYMHKVKALISRGGQNALVSLPLSYKTVADFYGIPEDPEICEYMISSSSRKRHPIKEIDDLIGRIGWDLYEYVIKGYSELQWGRPFEEIDPAVIDRIKMTKDFNDFYFKDKFQAMPKYGYDTFLKSLSAGLDIELESYTPSLGEMPGGIVVFTGPIDELIGEVLPYRSLLWEHRTEVQLPDDFEDYPVINTPTDKKSTRMIIHDNFAGNHIGDHYHVSTEYPIEWRPGLNRYYPVNNPKTAQAYEDAVRQVQSVCPNIIMGGRLGRYKYYDMDDTILAALELADEICKG